MIIFRTLLLLTAAGFVGAAQAVTFKIATVSPDGSAWMRQLREAASEIKEATEGRVGFKYYPGGVMGDDKAVLRKIRVGQLHGGVMTAGGLIPVYSDVQVYNLPMSFRSAQEVAYVRERIDPVLLAGLEDKGFVAFGISEVGFAYAMAKSSIVSVDEARQLKVWVPDSDPGAAQALQAFGISPIPLAIADVLAGLQTGLINAVAVPPVAAIALQWHTQLDYAHDLPLIYVYGLLTVSKRQFAKVDTADQQIVREVMSKHIALVDAAARRDNESARQAMGKQGMTWQQASESQRAEWRDAADTATKVIVDGGFVSRSLYDAFSAALDEFRDGGPTVP